MKLSVTSADISASGPTAVMNSEDCLKLGVDVNDRIRITASSSIVCSLMIVDAAVPVGKIVMPISLLRRCGASSGDDVEVEYSPLPESVRSIKRKINGHTLSDDEICSIVTDIQAGNLSEKEILSFVSAFNVNNADMREIAALTRAMADTGTIVDLGKDRLFDFHSLGGVPGNKITPIVVSIVASAGYTIPKMSSRAISSACGTSDYVDTFCDVEMDMASLKDAIGRTGGLFICGNEGYAPVGTKIIAAEKPMGIDPRPTMMASIMSKKVALGITDLVTDIPTGEGSKIPDLETAREYARDMIRLGKELGINVECAVTRADQPIGHCIGPILEARECIYILEKGITEGSVADKACGMAGMVLDLAGSKDGYAEAKEILASGKAHKKFLEIVKVQNGSPDITSRDMIPGKFVRDIHATRTGYVQFIDNPSMVAIARAAGAPEDTGAGIELLHRRGDWVENGETLFRIYAENQARLDRSVDSARSRRPMKVEDSYVPPSSDDMIIERITS